MFTSTLLCLALCIAGKPFVLLELAYNLKQKRGYGTMGMGRRVCKEKGLYWREGKDFIEWVIYCANIAYSNKKRTKLFMNLLISQITKLFLLIISSIYYLIKFTGNNTMSSFFRQKNQIQAHLIDKFDKSDIYKLSAAIAQNLTQVQLDERFNNIAQQ